MPKPYSVFDNIRESLYSAWKYKMLWVFALLALAGGSASGLNSMPNSGSEDFSSEENYNQATQEDKNLMPNLQDSYNDVLGAATNAVDPELSGIDQLIESLEGSILYIVVWGLLVLLVVVPFMLFVTYLLRFWAFGALVAGTRVAIDNEELKLKYLSDIGLKKVKDLFKFYIYIAFISMGAVCIALLIPLFLYLIDMKAFSYIVFMLSAVSLIIYFIFITYAYIYGSRSLVLLGTKPKESLKVGYEYFRKNFSESIALSVMNSIVTAAFAIIFLVILAALFFGSFLGKEDPNFYLLIPVILVALPVFALSGGFFGAYKEITWTRLFDHIVEKEAHSAK